MLAYYAFLLKMFRASLPMDTNMLPSFRDYMYTLYKFFEIEENSLSIKYPNFEHFNIKIFQNKQLYRADGQGKLALIS